MTDTSAEVHFAQRLASNEKKIRDRAIKKLRRWFEVRCQRTKGGFSEQDFLKVWKGLHYCMWMQDKPVIQEELASSMAQLVQAFPNTDTALKFVDVFFETEAREWNGIDRWRLDKFMMLVRCMLNQSMKLMKRLKWKKKYLLQLMDILRKRILDEDRTDGLKIHVTDIYLEELEKVGAEVLSADQVIAFLEPFIDFIQKSKNIVLVKRVISRVFEAIIEQSVGDAVSAAERQIEAEEGDEENATEKEAQETPPRLDYDFKKIADRLFDAGKDEACLGRNRSLIYLSVKKFRDLEQGILPDSGEDDSFNPKKGYINRREFAEAVSKLESLETVKRKKKKKKKQKEEDNSDITDGTLNEEVESSEMEAIESKSEGGKEKQKVSNKPSNKTINKKLESQKLGKKVKKKTSAAKIDEKRSKEEILQDQKNEGDKKKKAKKRKSETVLELDVEKSDSIEIDISASKDKSCRAKESPSKKGSKDVSPVKKKKNNIDMDFQLEEFDEDTVDHEVGLDTIALKHVQENSEKKKKKQNRKSKETAIEGLNVTAKGDDLDEGDVEIWVPNKKYTGKLKAAFEEQMQKAVGNIKQKPSKTKSEKSGKKFADFETLSKTPPAFVRKAVAKVTPKSATRKSLQEPLKDGSVLLTPSEGKKVIFNMKRNQARGFQESIQFSPDPFNPKVKPDHGILKTPERSLTPLVKKKTKLSAKKPKTPIKFK